MPYQTDGLVTDYDETIASGPLYFLSTMSIDANRPLTNQVMVLFYFTAFTDGTTVSSQTWNNWYDPYLVPKDSLAFEDSAQSVTLNQSYLGTATNSSGVVFTRPLFSAGTKVRMMRAQDITNIGHTFAAGSRVTSAALNNSIGQVFKSMQEVEDRLVKIEGATFEQPVPLNLSSNDLKINGGIVLESQRLALDLAASSITNSLPYTKLSGTPTLGTAAIKNTGTSQSSVIIGNDARLSNSRTPTAHNQALSTITDAGGAAALNVGTAAGTVAAGDDARLSNTRDPNAHNQALSTITDAGGAAALDVGTVAGTVAAGDDSRLSNTRDPNAHTQALSTITGTGGAAALDVGTSVGTVAAGDDSRLSNTRDPNAHNQLLATITDAGTSAALDVGTGANKVVQMTAAAKLPAVNGSLLTDLPSSAATVSYVSSAPSSPAVGDLWFNSTEGVFSMWLDDGSTQQWVGISGATGATGATGAVPTITSSYTGQIETVTNNKTYTIDPGAATNRTITGFYIKTTSGSVSINLKVGANVVANVTASQTTNNVTPLANTSVSTDDVITIETSGNSVALDLIFSVEYTQ